MDTTRLSVNCSPRMPIFDRKYSSIHRALCKNTTGIHTGETDVNYRSSTVLYFVQISSLSHFIVQFTCNIGESNMDYRPSTVLSRAMTDSSNRIMKVVPLCQCAVTFAGCKKTKKTQICTKIERINFHWPKNYLNTNQ